MLASGGGLRASANKHRWRHGDPRRCAVSAIQSALVTTGCRAPWPQDRGSLQSGNVNTRLRAPGRSASSRRPRTWVRSAGESPTRVFSHRQDPRGSGRDVRGPGHGADMRAAASAGSCRVRECRPTAGSQGGGRGGRKPVGDGHVWVRPCGMTVMRSVDARLDTVARGRLGDDDRVGFGA